MKLLLDTNAYSALAAGHAAARLTVSLAEHLYIPMPVVGELLFGFQLGTKATANLRRFQTFLAQGTVSLAPVDFEVCEVYARIGKQLRAKGTPIPSNDHWIAAVAIRHNFTLMTRDAHFRHIPGLALSPWTA